MTTPTQTLPAGLRPFRAGGAGPVTAAESAALLGTTERVLMADISEFQPALADAAYHKWSEALVIRAMYGADHDDNAWYGGARRAAWLEAGGQFLGIYQYLVASQDPGAQARALVNLVGDLRQGTEIIIADREEGHENDGWMAPWFDVIHSAYPWLAETPVGRAWDYSGLDYSEANGFAPVWLADYTTTEPVQSHKLWQFTDAYQIPGLPGPADCSVFHGSIADLKALITPKAAATGPVRHVVPGGNTQSLEAVARALPGNWDRDKLRDLSMPLLSAVHGELMTAYIALDNACIKADINRATMPTGFVYYAPPGR